MATSTGRHNDHLAIAQAPGCIDTSVLLEARKHLLAVTVHNHDVLPCRNEGVAIGKALAGDGHGNSDLPEDVSLEIAFCNAAIEVFRQQQAIGTQDLHIDWIARSIELPAYQFIHIQFEDG